MIEGLRRLARNDQLILWVLAVLMGLAAGLAAVAFRQGISLIQTVTYGVGGESIASFVSALPWWQIMLVPALGGLLVGLFVHFLLPGGQVQGVAQVIEASALRGGRMSLLTGIKASVSSVLSLGFGASVGREGPVVHLGASLGGWVADRLHLGRRVSRTLLGCGVAAAVACSFNAPIAGTFFALEVVVGHYGLSAFAPVVISAVTGTLISRAVYGDFPAFILPETWSIVSFWEFPAFAILGGVSAVGAIIFMRSIFFTEDLFKRLPLLPAWGRPAVGGLLLGGLAIFFPQLLGVGYEATDAALSNKYSLQLLLTLIVLKTAATAICLGSGFAGGVFSPSLFLGAMIGGAFGAIATSVFPDLSSGYGAYTMIGMGAVAGAVLGAPISTALMIFELTGGYEITIAVMIATAIASVITQQFRIRSFFALQLERRGLNIKDGREMGSLRAIRIDALMERDYPTIQAEAGLSEVREKLQKSPWGLLFVVDAEARLRGILSFADLSAAAFDTSRDHEFCAANLSHDAPAVLAMDDDLETALAVYHAADEAHVPVVDSRDSMLLVGMAHESEVLLAYHRALSETRAEESGSV